MMKNVEVKNLPEMPVAYIRNIGDYRNNPNLFKDLFERLCGWAGPKNLINAESTFLAVYYDDPNKTAPADLKMDLCLTVPEETEVDSEIQKQTLETGKFVVARFELKNPEEYGDAWTELYQKWIPENGYEWEEKPCYEIYRNDPNEHPEKLHIVDFCVPVK